MAAYEVSWYKRALNIELIKPKFAVMNPELTFSLPPFQSAPGMADIMAHVIERYFTDTPQVDELTDRLCEGVLKAAIDNAPLVMASPENYDARAEIMWASTLAHNDLSIGRLGDFVSHAV